MVEQYKNELIQTAKRAGIWGQSTSPGAESPTAQPEKTVAETTAVNTAADTRDSAVKAAAAGAGQPWDQAATPSVYTARPGDDKQRDESEGEWATVHSGGMERTAMESADSSDGAAVMTTAGTSKTPQAAADMKKATVGTADIGQSAVETSVPYGEAVAASVYNTQPGDDDRRVGDGAGRADDPPLPPSLELPPQDIPLPEGMAPGEGPIINPPQTEELAPNSNPGQPRETYDAFIQRTPGRGSIKIQASMGNQAYPVPGVKITISKDFTDGTHIFHTAETDEDGIVDDLMLPAPASADSQQPDESQNPINPFAVYTIFAEKDGFRPEEYIQVPVFDGVKSIQPVRLIPQGV